jgi:hypothetical protein
MMTQTLDSQPQIRFITAPNATYNGIKTHRYQVKARRFENCLATLEFQTFDVLVRQEVWANTQLNRLLKLATGTDWRVEEKEIAQVCHAF